MSVLLPSRRDFLVFSSICSFASICKGGAISDISKAALGGQVTNTDSVFNIVAAPDSVQLGPQGHQPTAMWCFNGSYPGPSLRVRRGDEVQVKFINLLPEPSSIHWHGIRLLNAMDGVPGLTQPPVDPGKSFVYKFVCKDAGTFWYHPHLNSSEQLGRGLIGSLIVEDDTETEVDHDLTWLLSDLRLDQKGQIHESFGSIHDQAHAGRLGNVVFINGSLSDSWSVPYGGRIRLRLINGSNARLFRLRLNGPSVNQVAIDGHPVPPRVIREVDVLAPGQRIDLIFDLHTSEELEIEDHGNPDRAYFLAKIDIAKPSIGRGQWYGRNLKPLPANDIPQFQITEIPRLREIPLVLSGGAMSRQMSPQSVWQMNGRAPTMGHGPDHFGREPLFSISLNESVVLKLINQSAWFHPMHLHGVVFHELLGSDSLGPARDTLLLAPGQQKRVVLKAEFLGDWMVHCHILEHQHSGLMGYFRVSA